MTLVDDLSAIGSGFADPVHDSQSVFRRALHAMSRPGEIVSIDCRADPPPGLHRAAGALLLVLLDQDTRLWLAPSLRGDAVPTYFRFHTGCALVEREVEADLALVGSPDELPRLASFATGTEEYPERSTTVIVQVEMLSAHGGWTLRGPGIPGESAFEAAGLGARLAREWRELGRLYPCGIDMFLVSGNRMAGLPRTTRIEM